MTCKKLCHRSPAAARLNGMTCKKLCHRSPAAARKWARLNGGGHDAKYIYRCQRHGDEVVYHFTRQEPAKAHDPRLQGLLDYVKNTSP